MSLPSLFPFIREGHPFFPAIKRLRQHLAHTSSYSRLIRSIEKKSNPAVTTRTLMKVLPHRNAWELKRIYTSLQIRNAQNSPTFHSFTWFYYEVTNSVYSPRKKRFEQFTFPLDPVLGAASSFFRKMRHKEQRIDILRYVPRRRITFAIGKSPILVGKLVRREDLAHVWQKLNEVVDVCAHSSASFAVPPLEKIHEEDGIFFQKKMPGESVALKLDSHNVTQLLQKAGAIHADFQQIRRPNGLPAWDAKAYLDTVISDMRFLLFFFPEYKKVLDKVKKILVRSIPPQHKNDFSFCHGDFHCGHILMGRKVWSVVDFDNALWGDPYMDMATLLSLLKRDAPFFADAFTDPHAHAFALLEKAQQAYLEGYQNKTKKRVDLKRLFWYRLCYEIHYVARMLKRDRFHTLGFERSMHLIETFADRL